MGVDSARRCVLTSTTLRVDGRPAACRLFDTLRSTAEMSPQRKLPSRHRRTLGTLVPYDHALSFPRVCRLSAQTLAGRQNALLRRASVSTIAW